MWPVNRQKIGNVRNKDHEVALPEHEPYPAAGKWPGGESDWRWCAHARIHHTSACVPAKTRSAWRRCACQPVTVATVTPAITMSAANQDHGHGDCSMAPSRRSVGRHEG
jgi:hypothetical protein